jgi:hypothetical protein
MLDRSGVVTVGEHRSSRSLSGLGCDWVVSRSEIEEEARA